MRELNFMNNQWDADVSDMIYGGYSPERLAEDIENLSKAELQVLDQYITIKCD